jgi:hypothetical protein
MHPCGTSEADRGPDNVGGDAGSYGAGYEVSVPFGENSRYDLIADGAHELSRVQCKTGRLREGTIRFATASTYGHLPSPREVRRSYLGEIDHFGVFCPETGGVYLIPIADVPTRTGAYLRVDLRRNAQRKRIRFACDYLSPNVLGRQVVHTVATR